MNFHAANQRTGERHAMSTSGPALPPEYRSNQSNSTTSSNRAQSYSNLGQNARGAPSHHYLDQKKKPPNDNRNQYRVNQKPNKAAAFGGGGQPREARNGQPYYTLQNGNAYPQGGGGGGGPRRAKPTPATADQGRQTTTRTAKIFYKQPTFASKERPLSSYNASVNDLQFTAPNTRYLTYHHPSSRQGQWVVPGGVQRPGRRLLAGTGGQVTGGGPTTSNYDYKDANLVQAYKQNVVANSAALVAPPASNQQDYVEAFPGDGYESSNFDHQTLHDVADSVGGHGQAMQPSAPPLVVNNNPWVKAPPAKEATAAYLNHDTAAFLKNKNIIVCISNFSNQVSTISVLNTLSERTQFRFNHYGVFEDQLWIEVQTPIDALALMKLHGLQLANLGVQPISIRLCFLRPRMMHLDRATLKYSLNQLIPLDSQMEVLDLAYWSLKNYSSGISLSSPYSLSGLCECILSYATILHTLSLSDNAISSTRPLEPLSLLQNLRILNLAGNLIRTTKDITALSRFSALRELVLSNNPISFEPNYRLLVLEVIPNLLVLDQELFSLQISFGNIERNPPSELLPTDNPFFFAQSEMEVHVNVFTELFLCTFDTDRKKLTGAYRARGSYFSCKVFRVEDMGRAPCKNTYAQDAFDIIQCILEFPASKHEPPKKCDFLWLPNIQNQALLVVSGHVTFADERYIYQRSMTLIPYNIEERWNFTVINDVLMLTQVVGNYEAMETQNFMVYD